MTRTDLFLKRSLDVMASAAGLLLLWPVIAIAALLARWDTRDSGLFHQTRIGRHGRPFTLHKIRTMRGAAGTHVTVSGDARITPLGRHLRRWKIDELPQLWNILRGDMSVVGPRPDVPGFADRLEGEDRVILLLRPGITGPATLKYRDEEKLLTTVADPERFNAEVLWPDKVAINRSYLEKYSFSKDLIVIFKTLHNP